jgi:alanine-glyoxylate transaminase/serine-glyoxylate transaminase/serine-pyruvate transaminase
MNPAMILGCLAGVEAALKVQGIPLGRNGIEQAIACLAEV